MKTQPEFYADVDVIVIDVRSDGCRALGGRRHEAYHVAVWVRHELPEGLQ